MTQEQVIAVTGLRDLDRASVAIVRQTITELLERGDVAELRFGGARGADSVALDTAGKWRAACGSSQPRLLVVVPGRLDEQPPLAAAIARRWADEVEEMGLPLQVARSYLQRNDKLVAGVDKVVAFSDGSTRGGTAYTIRKAQAQRIDVRQVTVAHA